MSGSNSKKLRKNTTKVFGMNVDKFMEFSQKQNFRTRWSLCCAILFKTKDTTASEIVKQTRRHDA